MMLQCMQPSPTGISSPHVFCELRGGTNLLVSVATLGR
jgi:hypothetical protein